MLHFRLLQIIPDKSQKIAPSITIKVPKLEIIQEKNVKVSHSFDIFCMFFLSRYRLQCLLRDQASRCK